MGTTPKPPNRDHTSPPVSAKEIASACGVSRRTVYRWARLGVVPSSRVGPKLIRFDPSAVDAALTHDPTKENHDPHRD